MRVTYTRGGPGRLHQAGRWLLPSLILTFGLTTAAHAGRGGPVRMARFAVVSGAVDWRPAPTVGWSAATINLPVRQGCEVLVPDGCRAELQFDDGSRCQLGSGALLTLQTLYSDPRGEFTELSLRQGECGLRTLNRFDTYQVDTPVVSCKVEGPEECTVDAADPTQVACWQGAAVLEGPQGRCDLHTGECLDVRDPNAPYLVTGLPAPDSFDQWCLARDRNLDHYLVGHAHHILPPEVGLVADDLDVYGRWHRDRRYGPVWVPVGETPYWRPYSHGRWDWEDPFGWTWVADEPWGWAPYHYGTWLHEPYGWAWCPGPRRQYWCPATVAYTEYGDDVGWCPLAPEEVDYPSDISCGFSGGDWSLYFSIGEAACYYPYHRHVWEPCAWSSDYVNQCAYGYPSYHEFVVNHDPLWNAPRFAPADVWAGGAVFASRAAFGGRGAYRFVDGPQANREFMWGRAVAAPRGGFAPVAGPRFVRPNALAMTPFRGFRNNVGISPAVFNRPIYRSYIDPRIARNSATYGRWFPTNPRPRAVVRGGGFRGGGSQMAFHGPGAAQLGRPGMGGGFHGPTGGGQRFAGGRMAMAAAPLAMMAGRNRMAGGFNRGPQAMGRMTGAPGMNRIAFSQGGGRFAAGAGRMNVAGRPGGFGGRAAFGGQPRNWFANQQNRARFAGPAGRPGAAFSRPNSGRLNMAAGPGMRRMNAAGRPGAFAGRTPFGGQPRNSFAGPQNRGRFAAVGAGRQPFGGAMRQQGRAFAGRTPSASFGRMAGRNAGRQFASPANSGRWQRSAGVGRVGPGRMRSAAGGWQGGHSFAYRRPSGSGSQRFASTRAGGWQSARRSGGWSGGGWQSARRSSGWSGGGRQSQRSASAWSGSGWQPRQRSSWGGGGWQSARRSGGGWSGGGGHAWNGVAARAWGGGGSHSWGGDARAWAPSGGGHSWGGGAARAWTPSGGGHSWGGGAARAWAPSGGGGWGGGGHHGGWGGAAPAAPRWSPGGGGGWSGGGHSWGGGGGGHAWAPSGGGGHSWGGGGQPARQGGGGGGGGHAWGGGGGQPAPRWSPGGGGGGGGPHGGGGGGGWRHGR